MSDGLKLIKIQSLEKIPPWVFQLYKSTQTGQVSDTTASSSIFKDPKVVGFVFVLMVAWGFALSQGTPSFLKTPEQLNQEKGVIATDENSEKTTLSAPATAVPSCPILFLVRVVARLLVFLLILWGLALMLRWLMLQKCPCCCLFLTD